MKKINLKLYFQKRKQRVSVFGTSPHFDWFVVLYSSLFFLVCGIVYAVYLYIQVNNGSLFEVTEDTSAQTQLDAKKDEIEKTVELINSKSFDESLVN